MTRARDARAAIRRELRADDPRATRLDTPPGAAVFPDRSAVRREAPPGQTPIIALERVSVAFDEPVLDDVSLELYRGETVVIVGESGTGKSTALKLILRLLVPDSGRVMVSGRDIGPD